MDQKTETLLTKIRDSSQEILKDNLIGVYLHGSLVLGSYRSEVSDLDFLIVVKFPLTEQEKQLIMKDLIKSWSKFAPKKGIEFHVMLMKEARRYHKPPLFDFHFSPTHLAEYQKNPKAYIRDMKGSDEDLIAHLAVIKSFGQVLVGSPISKVFSNVSEEDYWNSIVWDIKDSKISIKNQPMYTILNLCRALAFKEKTLLLSKKDGGIWAQQNVPIKFKEVIQLALNEYEGNEVMEYSEEMMDFVNYMLRRLGI
ncbi:aminoglycoside adenylyltransferase domain-containing protein [Xylocopilactobacillus apis]|uniref:Adenylyltransferase n=1 Tax=Xylocopilactobacillus apis TaxID=2932183 RepID=A0AAU9D5D0_9LACO|nr:aminoglycoside adenylyltransferase domain-containing protein [Xylocopilactobacillus apis]BDR56605.1 adenylyltransferase [Xylocopilactobacillus apis]